MFGVWYNPNQSAAERSRAITPALEPPGGARSFDFMICLSNPDVLRIAKQTVLKWIAEHPDVPIIDVSQNDRNGACECGPCAAIVKEEVANNGNDWAN